jgi:hypothetical protein
MISLLLLQQSFGKEIWIYPVRTTIYHGFYNNQGVAIKIRRYPAENTYSVGVMKTILKHVCYSYEIHRR